METEIVSKFTSSFLAYFDPAVVVLIILCGIIAKRLRPKNSKISMDMIVIVLAGIITILWAKFQSDAGALTVEDAPKYFFSYLTAIVTYDKPGKFIVSKINSFFKEKA